MKTIPATFIVLTVLSGACDDLRRLNPAFASAGKADGSSDGLGTGKDASGGDSTGKDSGGLDASAIGDTNTNDLPPGSSLDTAPDMSGKTSCTDGSKIKVSSTPAFEIDCGEVTVGRFRRFLDAGYGQKTKPPNKGTGSHPSTNTLGLTGWDPEWNGALHDDKASFSATLVTTPFGTWTPKPGPNENRPVNNVSWFEAFAFCVWDGGRLPSATEWQAVGGGRPAGGDASYDCVGDGNPDCTVTDIVPVGTFPRSGFPENLQGNVREWTINGGPHLQCQLPCITSRNVGGGYMLIMNGSFRDGIEKLDGSYYVQGNTGGLVTFRSADVGFRCAR
jgi:formylglycine-generating enzyme required for sulfatase activity